MSVEDPRARAEARIGTVLDEKWTLERLVGLGGMAAVYAGRHRNGARGAIKILHADLARIPEVRDRFLREGYAANKVEHPCAVKVLDDEVIKEGVDAGTAYLVMELLEGESLEERLHRQGKFSPAEVLAFADGVLDVLVAAHAGGIIHRDLKPENLLLVTDGEVGPHGFSKIKVLDFGLARIAHGEVVTRAGMAIGTPSYMAPEQAEGRSEDIDGRSDVFAVGALMFRLITGRRVHEATHVIELVTKMAKLPAPAIASVTPDVPPDVATIVDRALQFKREDRYPSAAAMRIDIRAAREGRPLPSREDPAMVGSEPTLVAEVAGPPEPAPRPALARENETTHRAASSRFGVTLSVAWVLLVVGGGVLFFALIGRTRVSGDVGGESVGRATSASASASASVSTAPSVAAPSASASVEDLPQEPSGSVAPKPWTAPKKPPPKKPPPPPPKKKK
ncbi:MAG: serine/threonine-protein kinase [Polyangiales bacterium]